MGRSYTEKTIKLLFGTATHCAYPGCGSRLIFKDRELYTPTAQIAHIRSEKANGPRYDASYPSSRINDFENLLLLCGEHHPPVDRHESTYSVEELLQWKDRQSQQGERQVAGAELAAIERILNREAPITSDAVLRGPVASLGQAERLQQANDRFDEKPLEAAVLFDEVAIQLEATPFAHHAAIIRSRQCAALESGKSFSEAAKMRIDLGWQNYFSGDAFAVAQQISKVGKYEDSLPDSVLRAVNGLGYAAAYEYERHVTLEDLADAFDEMEDTDQGALYVAMALAEESIAWRRQDLIRSRTPILSSMVKKASGDESGLTVRARILMCLADANDDWDDLAKGARFTYPPAVTSWIAARHARYLSLTGKPERAMERWQDAVDGAVSARLNDSAADWLYGLRATRVQYWKMDGDIDDLHRLAQSLRASGNGSVLPEPYPLEGRALSRMLDQKWPDALQYLHQHLRHAVVTASWSAELTVHERFGDLLEATKKWQEAPIHYIRSGVSKKLIKLAKVWPDQPLVLEPPGGESPHWERIAAYKFAASAGKAFPKEIARAWSECACTEISTEHEGHPQTSSWLPAFTAFSATADEASFESSAKFLDLTADSLRREPGTHRRTDEALIDAILKIYASHEALRDRVVEMLCDAILLCNEVAEQAVYDGQVILRENPRRVERRLSEAAYSENSYAALALIVADCDVTPALGVARKKLEQYIQPLNIRPGVSTMRVGEENAALLVRILDESDRQAFTDSMIARALEVQDIEANRASAMGAIAITGPSLSEAARSAAFDLMIDFAQEPTESTASMSHGDDPFSRFRFTVGEFPLDAIAIRAAGKLAHTSEHYAEVQRVAVPLLSSMSSSTCSSIARMLRDLPEGELTIDVEMLANHQSPWLRCVAAMAWTRDPQKWPGLGERLCADKDPGVRLMLAKGLRGRTGYESVLDVLRNDYRRDIQRALG
ncbi:HNH endonuclease signature motif containing protein [Streptomyces sp. RK75]|uniref:HNH endonuclease signature motif containing protein n=1 Tax=Streptomyces sp. RK75 TaxID=2824895 RepID=UPI001B37E33B|nr:HNH endonuclease signature motif containing protein [Streptomyces sp. RK75]MBQ0868291.1 HNH endonuclease [Streptomyces sp. RK75]